MNLSQRLETLIAMVPPSDLVLDVGCDHGYVSIELLQKGIARSIIASDLRPGPLAFAESHIQRAGLSGKIRTECCDGIPKDFQEFSKNGQRNNVTCLIAGMGGILIGDILKRGKSELDRIQSFVFSPQSDWKLFRMTCAGMGLMIDSEEMIEEDGKYYLIIRAVHGKNIRYGERELMFGPDLLKKKHPVLKRYLIRRKSVLRNILENLKKSGSSESENRLREVKEELELVEESLLDMENIR